MSLTSGGVLLVMGAHRNCAGHVLVGGQILAGRWKRQALQMHPAWRFPQAGNSGAQPKHRIWVTDLQHHENMAELFSKNNEVETEVISHLLYLFICCDEYTGC